MKKKSTVLLVVMLFLFSIAFLGWSACLHGISPIEVEEVFQGQIDRYETDDFDREWIVISMEESPYSANCRSNEEINSETAKPGTWVCFSLDGKSAYNVHLSIFA